MKRTLSLFLAIVMAVGIFFSVPFTVKTNAASVDDLTFEYRWLSDLVGGYFWQDENAYAVSGCNKSASGELVIPSTYNGKPVMEIDDYAFKDCTSLTAVTIPDSITKINYDAFYGCTSLKSITIPNSVTEISSSAFENCTSLASVTIPDNVYMYGNPFCNTAYYNNASNWEDGVLYIGNYLVEAKDDFSGSCTIKAGTKNVLSYAFRDCTSLTAVTIPESVTEIGYEAFYRCTNLASITIGDSLTDIYSGAFNDTAYYDNRDNWENDILYVGNVAVDVSYYCDSLITIKDGTTAMRDDLLTDCEHTAIIIPESVKYIGDYACGYYCEGDYCSKISGCIIYGKSGSAAETYANENGFEFVDMDTVSGIFDFKLNDDESSYYINKCICIGSTVEIPSTYNGLPVTQIRYWAFEDCVNLTSVTIPDSVTEIGDEAFEDCVNLTSVTIPDSINKIGEEAFFNCPNLKSVIIPESVTVIGDESFGYYKGSWEHDNHGESYFLGEVPGFAIIGTSGSQAERYAEENDITFFDVNAYPLSFKLNDDGESYYVYDCFESASGELVIPSTYNGKPVTKIGDDAFSYCTSLTSITIPESVTEIGWGAFYGCTSLTSVTISNSVTEIPYTAFSVCTNLESINVSSASQYYTSVDGVLFNKSKTELVQYPAGKKETSYTIPDSVTEIGWYAFCNCTSLTSVTIPKSVTEIDSDTFEGSNNLTIYGYTYSAAEDCAIKKDIPFVSIGKADDPLRYKLNENKNGYTLTGCALSYKGSVSIPSTYNGLPVTYIGSEAFYGCTGLTSVTIPNSVTEIGSSAFKNCTGLTSVTIPNSVTEIGSSAFKNCTGLISVTLPDSVIEIGDVNFYGCSKLTAINVATDNKKYASADGVLFNKNKTKLIKYPEGKSDKSYFIPSTVNTIDYRAFSGCISLTSVTIPNSVTSIGYPAFIECENLKTVQVGENANISGSDLGYYLDGNYDLKKIPGFTIYGISGSPAQTYAENNGFEFVNVTKPAAVKLSGTANVSAGVKVNWSKVDNISTYTVYRKNGNNDWKSIRSGLTGTSYTDTTAKSGTKYTYTVRATNVAGTGGYDKTGKSITNIAMPEPSVSNANGGVTVKWGKVTGAKGYYVYRKNGNGGWKKIATVEGSSKVSYLDETAKSGTTYQYTVKAYNGKTVSAYDTDGTSVKYLAMPKLSSATNTNGGVAVKWGKVTGAKGYYVYRKTGNGGWKKIATVEGGSKVSYLDETAKSGTTYKYTVKAYNGKTVSAYNTSGASVKYLAMPKLKGVSSAKAGVTVKWGKVTGASGYYVYRKTGNGGWKKLATVEGGSKVSYLDKSAKKGTTYAYTVRAYSGKTTSAYNTTGLKIKDKY